MGAGSAGLHYTVRVLYTVDPSSQCKVHVQLLNARSLVSGETTRIRSQPAISRHLPGDSHVACDRDSPDSSFWDGNMRRWEPDGLLRTAVAVLLARLLYIASNLGTRTKLPLRSAVSNTARPLFDRDLTSLGVCVALPGCLGERFANVIVAPLLPRVAE